jgi:hypothetical protein
VGEAPDPTGQAAGAVGAVKVYHRTDAAGAILASGFRDAEGTYGTAHTYRGVWVSAEPLGWQEGAIGDTILMLDVPDAVLANYEWVEAEKPHREFLVPAEILNAHGPVTVLRES